MNTLLSINDAVTQGIERLRKPIWAHPCTHLKIDLFDGMPGPWIHLYDPYNVECNGRDPVDVLCLQFDFDAEEYQPYLGPVSGSAEYVAAQAAYRGAAYRGA